MRWAIAVLESPGRYPALRRRISPAASPWTGSWTGDTVTDLPSFGTVKVGILARQRLVFVPLDPATVGPGYVKVSYHKHQVEHAPSIGIDGELPGGDEEAIFRHYGLPYEPGAGGERRLARR